MFFELKHNDFRINKQKLFAEYNFADSLLNNSTTIPILDKSILSYFSDMFPEERLDPLITSLPAPDRVNYASMYDIGEEEVDEEEYDNINEEGLPNDLTPTEKLLTKLIWGEVDIFLTILLVAAIENMSIEDVSMSLKKMKIF